MHVSIAQDSSAVRRLKGELLLEIIYANRGSPVARVAWRLQCAADGPRQRPINQGPHDAALLSAATHGRRVGKVFSPLKTSDFQLRVFSQNEVQLSFEDQIRGRIKY